MRAFYDWIRESVSRTSRGTNSRARSSPSSGSTRQNGALNYFVLHKDPIELTENVTQAFLGQRLTCARCHNHPLEKWTQKQYYQMANLFSRVGIKNGDDRRESSSSPRPPENQPSAPASAADRRRLWMASRCRSTREPIDESISPNG